MRLYDYPLSNDFLEFLSETKQKIDMLVDGINAIRTAIIGQNNITNIRQMEINSRLTKLQGNLYTTGIGANAGNLLVIHEPFVDNKSCDYTAIAKQEAEVVTSYNILTLKRATNSEVAVSSVRIIDGNGQPGNTHQVYKETGIYYARDGLHTDLGHIIDGKADTWFEYERICGLPGNRYRNTSFAGGLHWLKFDTTSLFIDLGLELDDLNVIGAIIVEPFIPSIPGYKPARLNNVIVDDGRGSRQKLACVTLDQTKLMTCMPQLTRRIKVSLAQDTGCQVWVGIPTEPYPISIVGMKYDPISGSISQPEYPSNTDNPGETAIIEKLFSLPTSEMAPALRYQIGLRQVNLLAHTYEKESEYVSKLYQVPGGIRSVQVHVNHTVPEALRSRQLVKVSFSVDDCKTWHYVAANDMDAKTFGLPRQAIFGQYVPQFARSSDALYLNEKPDTLRLKIELFRPDDVEYAQYITPVVDEYTIVIEQATEGSD